MILTYDEDRAFTLADDAATLQRIARMVPAERLRSAKFGDWSALEVFGHLADSAEIFAERVRRCVDEDRPLIRSFDQDALAREHRYAEGDAIAFARRVAAAHGAIIRLLGPAENAARPAVHSETGEVNAGHFGAYQAQHAHEHALELAAAFPPTA